MITVECYGQISVFKSKKDAVNYFEEGIACCDSQSSEAGRYAYIIDQLEQGNKIVSDRDY